MRESLDWILEKKNTQKVDPWTFLDSVSKLYFFPDMGPNEAWQIMCEFDASKKGTKMP